MHVELDALSKNGTREYTTLPPGKNTIASKWIFRVKRNVDGSIAEYKARLVA